jgi:hypothetical protein
VAALCAHAIKRSDIVFAWLPSGCQPFGTIFELGLARASGKFIVIAEEGGRSNLWWLAEYFAHAVISCNTVMEAWGWLIKEWPAIKLSCKESSSTHDYSMTPQLCAVIAKAFDPDLGSHA